jgi:hypothetical protein
MRDILFLNNEHRTLEKGSFLGVGVSAAPTVLREQLGLPQGTGLVVDHVDPSSPAAAAGLKKNDVLQRLDDQILIEPRQLSVLLRMRKPGDEVKLQIIRGAKPTTLSAKLEEREVASLDEVRSSPWADAVKQFPRTNVFSPKGPKSVYGMEFVDGQYTLKIAQDPGQPRKLTATDKGGKVVFEGPIDSPEQINKVPPDVRDKLKKLTEMKIVPATQPFQGTPSSFAPTRTPKGPAGGDPFGGAARTIEGGDSGGRVIR